MKLQGEEIYSVIPNRYPLMILDSLIVEENHSSSEIFLTDDEWFFKCHYPGNPILPLTLLVESMVQTFSAIFLAERKQTHEKASQEIPVISSISKMKMREACVPGDVLRLEAYLDSFRRGVAKGRCAAYKNGDENPIIEIEVVEVLPSLMVI